VSLINAFDDGEGVISDCKKNFHFFSVNLSQEVTFLFLHVMAMLGNIAIAVSDKMTIVGTLFGGFGIVHYRDSFRPIGQYASKFITNSYFVKKLKFQLFSPSLTFIFMWKIIINIFNNVKKAKQ